MEYINPILIFACLKEQFLNRLKQVEAANCHGRVRVTLIVAFIIWIRKEVFWTFAIGHFALGYLFGKGSSKLAHVKVNLPLLLAASVLPDVDLLLRFLTHRGPTHSILTITVLMLPFFFVYRKQAIPYFAALLSHILIGDFFTGGIQLFWPLSHSTFGALNFVVTSMPVAITEIALFLLTVPIMYKLGDLKTLLKPNNKNWALIVPLGAVLGPLLSLGRGQEGSLPILLIAPSLFYISLFAYAILIWLRAGYLKHLRVNKLIYRNLSFEKGNCGDKKSGNN
jgi:membrane-bound metal-dependent hydrolase YbcI (DUF457 family)